MKKKYFLGLIYRVDNDLIYNKILNDKNEIGGVKNSFIQIQFSKRIFSICKEKRNIMLMLKYY